METVTPYTVHDHNPAAEARPRRRYGRRDRDTGTPEQNRRVTEMQNAFTDGVVARNYRQSSIPNVALALTRHLFGWGRLGDYWSTEYIAEKTGYSRSTVWRALSTLAADGLIVLEHHPDGRQWVGMVATADLEPAAGTRRAVRDGSPKTRRVSRDAIPIGENYLIGGGETVTETPAASPPPPPPKVEKLECKTPTVDVDTEDLPALIAALVTCPDPTDVAEAVTTVTETMGTERATEQARHLLAEGRRYQWARNARDAITDRWQADRPTRPTVRTPRTCSDPDCSGTGWVTNLDGTVRPCPTCTTGEVSQQSSPQSCTSSPQAASTTVGEPSQQERNASGLHMARRHLPERPRQSRRYADTVTAAETPHTETPHQPPATVTPEALERRTEALAGAFMATDLRSPA